MGMEHAPDVDVIIALDVEDKMGIALQHTASQSGDGKLIGVARRSSDGMKGDRAVCGAQGLDEAESDLCPRFVEVVVDSQLNVPARQFPRQDRLFAHLRLA